MMQTLRNTIAGWLLGIRITGPELRALADKIEPLRQASSGRRATTRAAPKDCLKNAAFILL